VTQRGGVRLPVPESFENREMSQKKRTASTAHKIREEKE